MEIEILADAEAAARRAAERIAAAAREAIDARGRFLLAVSGGSTPGRMLEALSEEPLPWERFDVFQVDERVAPPGDASRNWTQLRETLLARARIPAAQVHAMPVEDDDLEAAAAGYARQLRGVAGSPPVLDLVHLGLGDDGHTASLVPGDAVLDAEAEVAVTGAPYQGRRRMTLTFPALNRARCIVWLLAGTGKAEMLRRLREGDASIPAGRVARRRAVVCADRAAAGEARR